MKSPSLSTTFGILILSAIPVSGNPLPACGSQWNDPLGPHFNLRADPNHPNEVVRNLGYLNEMKYLNRGPNIIFENLLSPNIPLEEQAVARNSTESPADRPARFIGAFSDTWWPSPDSCRQSKSIVDATEVLSEYKARTDGRHHFRLLPGILQGDRIGCWNDWYYPKQYELDFSEKNQYYELSSTNVNGKMDHYMCSTKYAPGSACWLQTGFIVADARDSHWLGYTGKWENMWSLCRLYVAWDNAFYYELRLVDGKKMENCTEPFSLELVYI